jgi:hypothetical protein
MSQLAGRLDSHTVFTRRLSLNRRNRLVTMPAVKGCSLLAVGAMPAWQKGIALQFARRLGGVGMAYVFDEMVC